MQVWADVSRVRSHLALLHRQERETRALADFLNQWLQQASQDPMADLAFIRHHLQLVRKEVENIRRRITLLENTADRLSYTVQSDNTVLTDLRDMLSSYET